LGRLAFLVQSVSGSSNQKTVSGQPALKPTAVLQFKNQGHIVKHRRQREVLIDGNTGLYLTKPVYPFSASFDLLDLDNKAVFRWLFVRAVDRSEKASPFRVFYNSRPSHGSVPSHS